MKTKFLLFVLITTSLRLYAINVDIRPDSIKTIDYQKEIKKIKVKPVRFKPVLYTSVSKDFTLVFNGTGTDGKNLKLFVDKSKEALDDSKRHYDKKNTTFDLSNVRNGKNHIIYLCLNELKDSLAKIPFNQDPKMVKAKAIAVKPKADVPKAALSVLTIDYQENIKKKKAPVAFPAVSYTTKDKNFTIVLTGTAEDGENLKLFADTSEDPIDDDKRKNTDGNTTFDISDFQDGHNHVLRICLNDLDTKLATIPFNLDKSEGNDKTNASQTVASSARSDFWQYINSPTQGVTKGEVLPLNLKKYRLKKSSPCLDSCASCEVGRFNFSNQIIYDAVSGLTYYKPYNLNDSITFKMGTQYSIINKDIILNAGEPLIYRVINVNPALYDTKLTDTAFSTNIQSNAMLDQFLSMSTDKFTLNNAGGEKKSAPDDEYLRVKAGLVLLNSEMSDLLENFRLYSRYYSCVNDKKQQALCAIDHYLLHTLGNDKYGNISFTGFVDIFLDPTSKVDSSLNKQLKNLYTQFNTKKYEQTYYFPQIPKYDQIGFMLSIKRKANSPYPSLLDSKYPTQTAYVKNYFKVDVSSGLFYGFMQNHSYSIAADSVMLKNSKGADSVLKKGNHIVPENVGKNEFGFASFIHFYYKWSTTVNISATLGAGINFAETVKPRYFAGASLLLGRNNRLCVTGGLEFGNQKIISDQYVKDTNGVYSVTPGTSSLVYKSKLSHAMFISLSYNLPFIKSKTAVTAPPDATGK